MAKLEKTYSVTRKGTGRQDHMGKNLSFPTDPLNIWGDFVTIGSAELAARLWSVNTYDRRGNIVFMDNFDDPVLKWEPVMIGDPASSVALSTLYSRVAGNSVKLAVGAGAGFYAAVYKYIPLPVETKLGIEASFTIPLDIDRVGITFVLYTGTAAHRTEMYYSRTNDLLYIAGLAPYTVATDINPLASDYLFHTMKLVIDYSTEKYIRVMFDDKEYDVSDVTYGVTLPPPGISGTATRIGLFAWNDGVGTPVVYADDVICTQNEPNNIVGD